MNLIPNHTQINIGIIVIAAGNSSRLGQMKQQLKLEKQTLLEKNYAIAKKLSPFVVVVLGYNHKKLINQLDANHIVLNQRWKQGMGSSIALGVQHFSKRMLEKNSKPIDAVMIMQCDQYRLADVDYSKLIQAWKASPKGIVASEYTASTKDIKLNKVTQGAPAIFSHLYYDELSQLKETGAKVLLTTYSHDLETVELHNAAYDVDTPDDFEVFQQYQNG